MDDRYPDSFIEQCIRGEASPDEIEEFIEIWHRSNSSMKLCEFLGMTEQEYSLWLLNPCSLPAIISSYRQKNGRD
ncbi:MAG: hypothetical protein ACOX5R_11060 [bacterium]